ncbi:MAG: hypothetical protein ABI811_10645 [Acidobacteriota bacterium]
MNPECAQSHALTNAGPRRWSGIINPVSGNGVAGMRTGALIGRLTF